MEKEEKSDIEFLKDKVFLLIKENADLEERVKELERLVRELIQWKEDIQIIQLDKNLKEIGFAIHNYHMEEAKEEE